VESRSWGFSDEYEIVTKVYHKERFDGNVSIYDIHIKVKLIGLMWHCRVSG